MGIEFAGGSQAVTFQACALGRIKREIGGGKIRIADAAIHTRRFFTEQNRFFPKNIDGNPPFREGEGQFQGIGQPVFDGIFDNQAIHHHIDGMGFLLVEFVYGFDFKNVTIDSDASESFPFQPDK